MQQHKFNIKRKRELNSNKNSHSGPVMYLMSRDQRASDNWALIHAQNLALKRNVPLLVGFIFSRKVLRANKRQYDFMVKGLKEVEKGLEKKNIKFVLRKGQHISAVKDIVDEFDVADIVVDFAPTNSAREWRKKIAKDLDIPVQEIDTHNIIPAWELSDKQEYAAYTIRKKVKKKLDDFLEPTPELMNHPYSFDRNIDNKWSEIEAEINKMPGKLVDWIKPGQSAAFQMLDSFIKERIGEYKEHKNNPNLSAISNLSPYFHFGHLSANSAVHKIDKTNASEEDKNAFFEQLIVRKELSDNYCLYNKKYHSLGGFPDWAQKTLNDHRGDKREFLYSEKEFEKAETHDDLWNASQMEMVKKGKMHPYLRMYWAKKILEWSKSPEEAQYTAIYLNDKYELDGRDPNGYAGIAWAIGGVHDRPWPERKIYGKIRYMNFNGAKRKFDVQQYIDTIDKI